MSWDASPFYGVIPAIAASVVILAAIATIVLLTVTRRWRWLWSEWLTSLDHKKIGIMYVVLAEIMLARAFIEAALMRTQQALGAGAGDVGPVGAEHFAQLFSTHGTIMIFFVLMPFMTGLINFAMPLQIGARDMTFPWMNSIALMLTIGGAGLVMASLVIGKFSTGGWTGYPNFTGAAVNPGVGPDYWIWALTLGGAGSTLSGINIVATIWKERTTGLDHLMWMPLFCWTSLCTALLMIFAFPALTVATVMLWLDRTFGFHFFTQADGGNMMQYVNLFWMWGHPEVYILILPAFGVYSEVIGTFSSKKLFGYTSLVWATMAIAVLSFTVWLHHFFTMGASANVNAVFGIATMVIAVPTGVKVYDWLLTMRHGRLRFDVPMLYAVGFIVTFVVGGVTGVLMAIPPFDYVVHNSTFLVAHFHNMVIPGSLFGMMAGATFWFPKAFGFRLDETWGRRGFWFWISGFYLAFMPLYVLGLFGMSRRMATYLHPEWQPWLIAAWAGAGLVGCGLICQAIMLYVSIRDRERLRDITGDAWDGRTLEWLAPSPPPEWNFGVRPVVTGRDEFGERKLNDEAYPVPDRTAYRDIEIPANAATAPLIGIFAFLFAFAAIWWMWWLVWISAGAIVLLVLWRSMRFSLHRQIPAETLYQADMAHRRTILAHADGDIGSGAPMRHARGTEGYLARERREREDRA
ncbi:cbb3-type cytochrome c oxidase subunit I [Roseicyclus sp. F158]|uniref:Cbb3-type cytochrome c oxidase subunit I n=1 Tax=Tropicimonas omnivorans TaxID=3075590 RepID=A0ABU3DJ42_9RHOB|nr:cbb3-type cytochrome c oxidase subunit I [Roseicyclus sp. F158]MDT0683593.1 cbb3-type cytochrome c oxidase subunit I [Roseicyclus sp. F158]